jgi:hypothetical protein
MLTFQLVEYYWRSTDTVFIQMQVKCYKNDLRFCQGGNDLITMINNQCRDAQIGRLCANWASVCKLGVSPQIVSLSSSNTNRSVINCGGEFIDHY